MREIKQFQDGRLTAVARVRNNFISA